MSALKDNKILRSLLEILLFIITLPITTIILKSIFALGILLGTYTGTIGL